ncbi:hypothetical protein [Candidatus Amarobacter glycogenicus]|uniref:hypothetical protein n=1 Tax=Candidatus Amarobacter glycogenicus TaxID=3140699 RepID=UPI0031CCCA74
MTAITPATSADEQGRDHAEQQAAAGRRDDERGHGRQQDRAIERQVDDARLFGDGLAQHSEDDRRAAANTEAKRMTMSMVVVPVKAGSTIYA